LEESGLTLREHYSAQNLVYICSYTQDSVGSETMAVICQISDMDFVGKNKLKPQQIFLSELSNKFFINAPQTQIFLFLPKQVKYSLFKERQELDYKRSLQLYQKNLTNFFVYEFIPISFIIKTFKTMRDLDFKEAVRTGGNYGQNYKNLFYSLSNLLGGKQVTLSDDLSSIIFTKNINGKEIELGPEDLSHGELKRLSLYLWLKYTNIQDSIVLMDEIELALHPDWQYQIVQDLMEWAPSNQYILATHSYAVCEALTPAHVKGLEPRLTPPTTPNPSESP
jgi:predicted ATP-dependent endonuclease of OLD family